MKKPLKIILKVLKWGAISICSFYFFMILVFGFKKVNSNGSRFYWSGLEAFWKDDENFTFHATEMMKAQFDGIDGPYVVSENLYYVAPNNKVENRKINNFDSILVRVNNAHRDKFSFRLNNQIETPRDTYDMPEKIVAISDIEGNFDGFSSFLISNKIIDTNYNWTFGKGHLVLNGDFVDRGNDVTQVLWLIYKLDKQAEEQGGKVHYILGNHEIMNFQGKWSYNRLKYIKLAQTLSKEDDWDKAVRFMYSDKTELGKWLRTKNVIEKIGSYIFVHAGLSPEILEYNLSIPQINSIIKQDWDSGFDNNLENDKVAIFLRGENGPFWYRGMTVNYSYFGDKITESELNKILSYYRSEKIIIGHTIVKDIAKYFNGKVINIDLKHGQEKNTGKTKGLLFENGAEYKIDDKGVKTKF